MPDQQIIQRGVKSKWSMTVHKDTAIHKAGLVLPPGNWKDFDPFLVMAEDRMRRGAFDYHPHRGIETVTYMIDGVLNHSDNRGNQGKLKRGDTQWMTAGSGLLHLEEAPEDDIAHLLQLWVNLPAANKMDTPRYQDIPYESLPVRQENGAEIRVISGSSGDVRSTTANYAPVIMVEILLQKGHTVKQDLRADLNGFIYVLGGSGVFGSNEIEAGKNDVLWLEPSVDHPSEIAITAMETLKVLLFAGQPLREPIAARGPFVMNTEAQLDQAFKDFRDGKFGSWND
jgi:redox-sensitive bicupin YhaK (pirin superfamily)